MKLKKTLFIISLLVMALIICSCGDDDDDTSADDDDDSADVFPTTLDVTFVPVADGGNWVPAQGPGEPHQTRNDLNVYSSGNSSGKAPLSMAYFMTLSDLHQADEESPTRLSFYDSLAILGGMFDAAFRPQEDLAPQLLNALVRTGNRIQADYGRNFDMALILGDVTDNAQKNELKVLVDILDGSGLSSGMAGWARPDSGDLNINPETHLNEGERDFDIQETDDQGNNINAFHRTGYPNSNADVPVVGLLKSDGSQVPWYCAVGNHDALNTGNFDPRSELTFFKEEDYISDVASFGFIPGIGATIKFWQDNPDQNFYISQGILGWGLEWNKMLGVFDRVGLVPDDYSVDIDSRFDLFTLINGTPDDPSDDGVIVTADSKREFMGLSGVIDILHGSGHGFADNNNDSQVNEADGGYYSVEWSQTDMPLRVLMLDSTDEGALEGGGFGHDQLTWFATQLDKAKNDKVLIIVVTHHYEGAIEEGIEEFHELIWGCPNVFLHLDGHGHDNVITAHQSPDYDAAKGYWEVEMPSGIEFPQQSNIVEIVDNRDGTGSIYLTLFDHWTTEGDDSDTLATLGKQLAFDDAVRKGFPQGEVFGGSGTRADRNQVLIFAIPDDVAAKLSSMENGKPVTSVESLGKLYKAD